MYVIKKANGKDVEKRQLSYFVGGNINWCRHNGKERFLNKQTSKKKKKNHTAEIQYDSEMLILGIYQKDFASRSEERSVLPHSLQLFTIAKT